MYVACILGAGGIGSAVSVLLRQLYGPKVDIYIGDIRMDACHQAKEWILSSGDVDGEVHCFDMNEDWVTQLNAANVNIVLDCLPGKMAPKMAKVALGWNAHYVNLTEYVAETKEIMAMAEGAQSAFGLQSGVAPGFVNVLGKKLFEEFCSEYHVQKADRLEMRVGALSRNAVAPHFYAFTWSTIGVATEYVKPAEVVRNHEFMTVPSLSERRQILVDGLLLEEDLTSGGAADLPMTYKDRIANIDYKTFRYPGHWEWVDSKLAEIPDGADVIAELENHMLANIPSVEADLIVVYAAVEGKDQKGHLRRIGASYRVEPMKIGAVTLRAIQSTTAAGMAEVARMLLEGDMKGVVLQSSLDAENYLSGPFVSAIYGERR